MSGPEKRTSDIRLLARLKESPKQVVLGPVGRLTDPTRRRIYYKGRPDDPEVFSHWCVEALWSRLQGPEPPNGFQSNGCTASPDSIRGYWFHVACHWHDWHYSIECSELPRNWAGRRLADGYLRRNMQTCLAFQAAPWYIRHTVDKLYWAATRRAGQGSYDYEEGQAPEGRVDIIREAAGLFLPNKLLGVVGGIIANEVPG